MSYQALPPLHQVGPNPGRQLAALTTASADLDEEQRSGLLLVKTDTELGLRAVLKSMQSFPALQLGVETVEQILDLVSQLWKPSATRTHLEQAICSINALIQQCHCGDLPQYPLYQHPLTQMRQELLRVKRRLSVAVDVAWHLSRGFLWKLLTNWSMADFFACGTASLCKIESAFHALLDNAMLSTKEADLQVKLHNFAGALLARQEDEIDSAQDLLVSTIKGLFLDDTDQETLLAFLQHRRKQFLDPNVAQTRVDLASKLSDDAMYLLRRPIVGLTATLALATVPATFHPQLFMVLNAVARLKMTDLKRVRWEALSTVMDSAPERLFGDRYSYKGFCREVASSLAPLESNTDDKSDNLAIWKEVKSRLVTVVRALRKNHRDRMNKRRQRQRQRDAADQDNPPAKRSKQNNDDDDPGSNASGQLHMPA